MICPDCCYDNIDGVDVCEQCGTPLVNYDPTVSEMEESICRHPIEVLCPREPVSVGREAIVRDAIAEMLSRNIGCLLVVEEQKPVGILTERDILNRVSAEPNLLDRTVGELMTQPVETITRDDSIAYALHAMDLGGYRHLPVVDARGRAVGIISIRDILRFLCIRFAELREA